MEREIHNEDIVSQCLIQAGICFLLSRWMVFRLHAGSELVNVTWLSLLLFAAVHLIFGVMKEELSVKGKVMTCSGSGFLTASAIFRILLRGTDFLPKVLFGIGFVLLMMGLAGGIRKKF